jgi:hypothetical protein
MYKKVNFTIFQNKIINMKHPIAEVFGFPIINESDQAKRYRANRLCPFNNIVPNCTKNSIEDPLGVCSIYQHDTPVIICPVRFRQDWLMIGHAANFFFDKDTKWTSLGEIRLKDVHGKSVGNIDYVLVAHDDYGSVLDFASLEVQAVYISGNLTGPFKSYMHNQNADFEWSRAMYYPTPDYLSSSKKRLVPQLLSKGSIIKSWGKKQAVSIQTAFYNTLVPFEEVEEKDADLAWFLYDLVLNNNIYEIALNRIIYTKYENSLDKLIKTDPGDVRLFIGQLELKLKQKMAKGNEAIFLGDEENHSI